MAKLTTLTLGLLLCFSIAETIAADATTTRADQNLATDVTTGTPTSAPSSAAKLTHFQHEMIEKQIKTTAKADKAACKKLAHEERAACKKAARAKKSPLTLR